MPTRRFWTQTPFTVTDQQTVVRNINHLDVDFVRARDTIPPGGKVKIYNFVIEKVIAIFNF